VAVHARAGDYSSVVRPTTLGGGRAAAAKAQPARATPLTADAASVEEMLHLLARAVQQFHTYPPTSQMCVSAIDACQRALVALDGREQIVFRVMPRDLIVDETAVGSGSTIEVELARRLHAASIAQVTIERMASTRELARFSYDLVQCDSRNGLQLSLIDLLEEHGVSRIALRKAYRPQVLEIAPPAEPIIGLIEHQRARREELFAAGGPIDHLYPPDKGWVRVDPGARVEQVSLVDLALLAQDPTTLAGMLLRLTEDDVSGADGEGDALSRKFTDVATLFAALDPRVSRVMFGKLARAVLDLEPESRQTLLRKTILPGLLDGRVDGNVLKDFPDVDLAESLCLLLDLETAAPEVVTTALARLDLTPDRQASVLPLVEAGVEARRGKRAPDSGPQSGLDAHARKLMRIDREKPRSFAEFASFDLALDPHAVAALESVRDAMGYVDVAVVQLECLLKLVRLEPNPELVQRFVERAAPFIEALEREDRWYEIAAWLSRLREMTIAFQEQRPDVAEVIAQHMIEFCTVYRAARLVELAGHSAEGRAAADAIVQALGAGAGPALLEAIRKQSGENVHQRDGERAAVQLLCDHAALVAPSLVAALERTDVNEVLHRVIARVLGFAGAGYELPLSRLLGSPDEQTVREALRSLAKIGTPRAAALVATEIARARGWIGGAAEQTLWHFPKTEVERQLRELLAKKDFVISHPQVAGRLLERTAQHGSATFAPILRALAPLRFRFWNPALVRVARQAKSMLAQG
jgi:hypothetical protein